MKAFIFCGGLGTRLRPYTLTTPKPLIKLYDKPNVEYILLYLAKFGIKQIGVNTFYLSKHFDYLPNWGKNNGLEITLFNQNNLYQTAGDLAHAEKFLENLGENETFFAINGDTTFYIDFKELENAIKDVSEQKPMLVIGFQSDSNPLNILNNKIVGLKNKPYIENAVDMDRTSTGDNTGIQIFHSSIKQYLRKEDFGFYTYDGLVSQILNDNKEVIYFEPNSLIRFEVSTKEDYESYKENKELIKIKNLLQ